MRDEIETFSCKHDRLVFDDETGEHICRGCGRVIDSYGNTISNGVGFPALLGSRMLQDDRQQLGISPKLTYEYSRDAGWYEKIGEACKRARMPEFIRNSIYHFYLRYREELRRARGKEAITALMYAYGKGLAPQQLKELSEKTGADLHMSRRYLLDFVTKYELKVPYRPPGYYIDLYASRLNAPKEVVEDAHDILGKYDSEGSNPRSLAASSLYLAYKHSGEKMTQRELAELAGVTEYTVRDVSAKIKEGIGGEYDR